MEDAVNEGVRQGYVDGYLRKSVVEGSHLPGEYERIIHPRSFIIVLFRGIVSDNRVHRRDLAVRI